MCSCNFLHDIPQEHLLTSQFSYKPHASIFEGGIGTLQESWFDIVPSVWLLKGHHLLPVHPWFFLYKICLWKDSSKSEQVLVTLSFMPFACYSMNVENVCLALLDSTMSKRKEIYSWGLTVCLPLEVRHVEELMFARLNFSLKLKQAFQYPQKGNFIFFLTRPSLFAKTQTCCFITKPYYWSVKWTCCGRKCVTTFILQ